MESQVDYKSLLLSSKILTVLFIILICLLNGILILTIVAKGSVIRSPRRYIIACMSFANLFLALFTLVVNAMLLFEPYSVKCRTRALASTYDSLHPFVTGCSIMVLCAELFFRKKIRTTFGSSLIVGILLGGAPWVLGLIIILPLNLAGFNYIFCGYEDGDTLARLRAIIYVSVILPICAVLISNVVIKLKKVSAVAEFYSDDNINTPYSNQGGIILQPPPAVYPSAPHYAPSAPFPSSDYNKGSQYPTDQPPSYLPSSPANQPQQPLHNPGPAIPANQYQPALNYNYIPGPTSASTVTQAPYTVAQSNQVTVTEQDVQREKTSLFVISCIYAVVFLPFAIFMLAYFFEQKPMNEVTPTTFYSMFLYLRWLWGISFPIVCLTVLKLQ